MAFGVIFFITGMFLMYLSSTLYHWVRPGMAKDVLRRLDHISIYVMIACSYTPICVGVIGGWAGWTIFGMQWGIVLAGTFYKIFAFGKYPRLSLAIYLVMGWSALLVAPAVFCRLSAPAIAFLLAEGVFYTAGTYFFSHVQFLISSLSSDTVTSIGLVRSIVPAINALLSLLSSRCCMARFTGRAPNSGL